MTSIRYFVLIVLQMVAIVLQEVFTGGYGVEVFVRLDNAADGDLIPPAQ